MIEHTPHTDEPQGSSNRSFGMVFACVFLLVAVWPLFAGGSVRWWSLAIATVFFIFAIARPDLLAKPNRAWIKLGLLLGMIVSPIALGLVFFVAILPIGLLMRLTGKDPLRLRADKGAASYWMPRDPPARPDDSMRNQF